ncbi:MAG: ATP-grasp domain-containing protein [Anaerolineae bacterium]|nr:ATP-grasp domain-containing protein [Anaerolineae bacterium]MBT7075550.1 ATP-grasp domain-containing protein [Anaerolineae bacterium]MBT7783388.1 ATP-grasp domain-containing protein [Anaerolineae bacterium]
MILVDKPYLSDFLKKTSIKFDIPIVDTEAARDFDLGASDNLITEKDAKSWLRADADARIYTNSENAIGWITENLAFTDLPAKIEVFKNKAKFRELMRPMLPDFYFQEVALSKLDDLIIDEIPLPFIIKPNVGFFSLGVHKVSTVDEWNEVKAAIKAETAQKDKLYPTEVLNTTTFIIEENIDGEEYAFDAYFDENGSPIILGIYKHLFSSANDVSDRIYITSKEVIEENLSDFTNWLQGIGNLAKMSNFPVHVEVRRTEASEIAPIEVNPLRFGGWCTTADMTAAAYGFNPYLYYFENKHPNWDEILSTRAGKLYSLVVLDNSTGYSGEEITKFDYDALLATFENPLELRKIDYKEFPVFGFLFLETREENFGELERILKSNLKEFAKT